LDERRAEDIFGLGDTTDGRSVDGEPEAPLGVDVEVGDRSRRELASTGKPRLRPGFAALREREDRDPGHDEQRDGPDGDDLEQAAVSPLRFHPWAIQLAGLLV